MNNNEIHIFGGGTFSHVRNHMSLAVPAFGSTARRLASMFQYKDYDIHLHLTKMASGISSLVTNDDVERKLDEVVANPNTKIIIFNAALCDFNGTIDGVDSGKYAERLKSRNGNVSLTLTPADKLLSKIRKIRKDIFLVAFKTTCGFNHSDQYVAGLNLLKENSVNLVLANDTKTRNNMIIVPEEAYYAESTDRDYVLSELVDMILSRSALHFTRSTVVPGNSVDWNGEEIPSSLRTVVNHCIANGAYKPFRGKTAGHFAVKVDEKTFLTSKRSTDFNKLSDIGLVKVVSRNKDEVIAYGAKPSVGGQSQRIIFAEHQDVDCIVHFHSPLRNPFGDFPVRAQKPYECGSHECGQNTSNGLEIMEDGIKAVMLDNHGPNIVFNHDIDPLRVIGFIDKYFDLSQKTGGYVQ